MHIQTDDLHISSQPIFSLFRDRLLPLNTSCMCFFIPSTPKLISGMEHSPEREFANSSSFVFSSVSLKLRKLLPGHCCTAALWIRLLLLKIEINKIGQVTGLQKCTMRAQ